MHGLEVIFLFGVFKAPAGYPFKKLFLDLRLIGQRVVHAEFHNPVDVIKRRIEQPVIVPCIPGSTLTIRVALTRTGALREKVWQNHDEQTHCADAGNRLEQRQPGPQVCSRCGLMSNGHLARVFRSGTLVPLFLTHQAQFLLRTILPQLFSKPREIFKSEEKNRHSIA